VALRLADESVAAVRAYWATERESDEVLSVIELGGERFMIGPHRLHDFVMHADHVDIDALIGIGGYGSRPIGTAKLAYADASTLQRADPNMVTAIWEDDPRLRDLEAATPEAEWREASMDEPMDERFAIVVNGTFVACAGYRDWDRVIGQQCVLAHPAHRRHGYAQRAAAVASGAAIDRGLVAQWRSSIGNTASEALGARLGFVVLGTQATVLLG
jgi:RimJ/RimL family protein N-acetyltransferase